MVVREGIIHYVIFEQKLKGAERRVSQVEIRTTIELVKVINLRNSNETNLCG